MDLEKRAIVAGATGFIGSNLVRHLLEKKYQVGILLRKESNSTSIEELLKHITIYEVDYENKDQVYNAFLSFNCTHLFNCAQPSFKLLDGQEDFVNMLGKNMRVLMSLLEGGSRLSTLKSLMHCCSSTVYGWSSDAYLLSEETPINPTTLRGIAKATERNLCRFYATKKQLPVRLARIFRAYGPWDNEGKLIVSALNAMYQNQELSIAQSVFKRDYVYVGDLVNGMIDLAESNLEAGTEINFGGGQEYSAEEIVGRLEDISGLTVKRSARPYPRNIYDKGRYLASIQKAKDLLNWQPKTTIDEGLSKTIEWFNQYEKE